jgi:hypothetical protein
MRFALLLCLAAVSGCAGNECDFHSECGEQRYCERGRCRRDCEANFDCDPGQVCNVIGMCVMGVDAEVPEIDAGMSELDAGPAHDAGREPDAGRLDAGADAGMDAGRFDAGGDDGRYLDRCTGARDCTSGLCVDDVGGTRMCTIACSTHRDCASEHVCAAGRCVPDDTGGACAAASTCALGLCVGNAMTGTGQCTRPCTNASECPAGFACADAGGTRVCVDIERPCGSAAECATGLCIDGLGCTAECRTAADCPARFPMNPAYTCQVAHGSANPICAPPFDIAGSDPIGAFCRTNTSDELLCRSATCDTSAPLGAMCTQVCTEEGGCGSGLACFPLLDADGSFYRLCSRAGTRALGAACINGRDCDSGLCDSDNFFCTRLCTDDGLCPSGMSCRAIAGLGVSACRR